MTAVAKLGGLQGVLQDMPNEEANKIDLLDHGFVRLVDSMGGDLSIVRAARVSYDAAWRAGEDQGSDDRLIRYLWRNHHTTPFEAVTLTFEVKAPIFVFRQWHRHRTWSFNELSARYRELPAEYYLPEPDAIGVQSANSKQARDIGAMDEDALSARHFERLLVDDHCHQAFDLYANLIAKGWPRELARSVLPVSTYSHMFATVNLLNLLRFLTLRCDGHAQYEIRVYADAMRELARSWRLSRCQLGDESVIVISMQNAREALPSLGFPLLVIGIIDGWPFCVERAKDAQDYLSAAEFVLYSRPDAHVVITSLMGGDPTLT